MSVQVDITYDGDLHCTATHGPSGSTLQTDAPVDNQGKGEAFSPTDLVGTAMGTCMLTIMGILARREQIDLRGAKVRITKEMVTQPLRRIGRLTVEFEIPGDLTLDQRLKLENAALTCPVHRSMHPSVQIPITFRWGDGTVTRRE